MILAGHASKMNEAHNYDHDDEDISRFTYSDYKEMDPRDYDDGQVQGWIKDFETVAKLLKIDKSKMIQITEENRAYNKLISMLDKKVKTTPVNGLSIDGKAGLSEIKGNKVVTTNEWGYGTIYLSIEAEKSLLKH